MYFRDYLFLMFHPFPSFRKVKVRRLVLIRRLWITRQNLLKLCISHIGQTFACHIKVEDAGHLKRDFEVTENYKPDDKYKTISQVFPWGGPPKSALTNS
jgi:hypothetical protein